MVMLSSGEIEVAGVREEHPTIFSPLDIVAICLGGMPAINIALAPLSLSVSLCIPAAPRARSRRGAPIFLRRKLRHEK